jgi:VWFA-related protein
MKNRRSILALAVLGFVGVAVSQSVAQQAPAPVPGVIRINVNLVQVDAVVTDSKDKPVTDLKAEDFEILQDKKVQKIRNFEFVRVRNPLTATPPTPTRSQSSSVALPPPPSKMLRPEQVRRTVILVVDDIALSGSGVVRVREALKKWVDNEMQPGDLVSVVRTNASTGSLQQFTNDKRLLYFAMDQLKFQPGRIGIDGFSSFTAGLDEGQIGIDTTLFDFEHNNALLYGSINAVRYAMQGLRDVPGRKSLILFSEDMRLSSPSVSIQRRYLDDRQGIEDLLRGLADEANRASVVIHAIDPRGVVNTGMSVSDTFGNRDGSQIASLLNQRADDFTESQDGMRLLTQRTGGLFFANNDLPGSLDRAVDDGDGYYLMGYQPDGWTFDENTVKYHSIQVRVKRPGLKVRSRSGFLGMKDAEPVTAKPDTREKQLAKALVSPFTTAELPVRLTALYSMSEQGPFIQTLLRFDARDLSFTDEADGARTAAVDVAVVTFDANGNAAENVNKTLNLRITKDGYDEVLKKGLVYSVPVPLKKSGPMQLRVALRDAKSQKLGSAMQFVDVPDLKSGRLALSGIVVTADPPNPDDPDGSPAVRTFKAGGAVSYAYEIFNVPVEAKSKAQLEMQVRLFRDGQIVYQGTPAALNNQDDSKRLGVGGKVQLTRIPPGDYMMQVIVADKQSKDKSGVAAQAIDFEVRQ